MATASASRLFRVVLASDTSLRLMEKGGDGPSRWRFPFTSGPVRLVTVGDILRQEQGLPRHQGFQYTVEIEGSDIDQAAEDAHGWAETIAFTLAAARRAAVGRVVLQLAYEITPDIAERDFRQWYWDPPIPIAKPPVDQAVFGELRERIDTLANDATAERLLWRSIISLSWFRQALEETDPLFRFYKLWVGVEALNPLLDEHYGIPTDQRAGFQGLRKLAEEEGMGSDWVSGPLGLRRQLFHAVRVTADDLRRTADSFVAELEALCVAGWKLLLGVKQPFPDESVVPNPLYIRLDGVLIHHDESTWNSGSHPFLEARFDVEKVPPSDPRDVTFKMSVTYTVRNTEAFRATGQGMWGPAGYKPLTLEKSTEADS
jgi:hypothetical protein